VRVSADGEYFMATGCYPPQLRIYELRQLSMKVKRHVDAELVQLHILSDDYKKVAMLRADRTLELHAQYGVHYKTRIPTFGRDLTYEPATCDLVVAGAGPELWALSLDEGRYREPILTSCPAVNVLARSAVHGMLAVGGEDGLVECVDPRSRARLGMVEAGALLRADALGGGAGDGGHGAGQKGVSGVTALAFDESGLVLGVGLAGGHVLLYDIRMARPMLHKDHGYGLPIKTIQFARAAASASEQVVLSADSKAIRLWARDSGAPITTIEPAADINEVALCPRSGLLLAGLEQPNLGVYFVPALGPAPRWCAFLDSLTEEMEEAGEADGGALYDDYRFVTRDELERLGLASLVGTNMLRAYMHGFFLDARLHAKAVALSQPFAYEEWRQQRIQQKVDEATAGRIAPLRKAQRAAPDVNAELAAKLSLADGASNRAKKRAAAGEGGAALLSDARFGGLFSDPDFAIDQDAPDYKMLHGGKVAAKPGGLGYNKVALADRMREDDDDADDDDDDEGEGDANEDDDEDDDESDDAFESESDDDAPAAARRELVAVDGGLVGGDVVARARAAARPRGSGPSFEKLLAQQQAGGELRMSGSARGSAEMTFVPLAQRKKAEARKERAGQRRDPAERRGVRELGLKSSKPVDYRRRKG
jgi:ribosome biogenesis protein ENP2